MPSHETEAIVLRQYSLSEADRIVVFLTREFGKVRGVGKGLKKPQSRMAACLEPLNHIRLHFYLREGAELSQIRQCETLHSYLGSHSSLEQFFAFNYFAEIVNEFVQENSQNKPFFRLFLASMKAGEKLGVWSGLIRYFEIWALRLNGWLPNYDYCSACRKYVKDVGFYAGLGSGEGFCSARAPGSAIPVGPAAAGVMRSAAEVAPEQFSSVELSDDADRDLERLTGKLLELHLEKRLKSYEHLKETLKRP